MIKRLMIEAVLILLPLWAISQNLLPNGDFEQHKPFCHHCTPYISNRAIEFVLDWGTPMRSEQYWYCHTEMQLSPEMGNFTYCDSLSPHSGEGMMMMHYVEACPFAETTPTGKVTGCPEYIHAQLSKPLVVGNVYEISMWVYFPLFILENNYADTTIFQNIGFNLTLKRDYLDYHQPIKTDYFFAGSIIPDQWYEIKHYVRALCPLQYITIGAFYDDHFPTLHRSDLPPKISYFFIDDVSVKEVNEDTLDQSITPTPFCNFFEKKQKQIDEQRPQELSVYFETANAELDAEDKLALDNFYENTGGNSGNIYVVAGHTDNEAYENLPLSQERANAVVDYLRQKHELSPFKFVAFAKGDRDPVGDNRTPKGRQQNRRVTISNSNIKTIAAVYRTGLDQLYRGDVASAQKSFRIWIGSAPKHVRMTLLHDPRLVRFRNHAVWPELVGMVKKEYEDYVKPAEAFFLDSMYFADQRFRMFSPYAQTGIIPGLDTFSVKSEPMDESKLHRYDSMNLIAMENYLRTHEYPRISHVGRRQGRTMGLILNHAVDTAAMARYLPVIESYCLEGEAEWEVYALVYDRLQLRKGLPQKYGTQYVFEGPGRSNPKLYKYDDLQAMNARRMRLGMNAIVDK